MLGAEIQNKKYPAIDSCFLAMTYKGFIRVSRTALNWINKWQGDLSKHAIPLWGNWSCPLIGRAIPWQWFSHKEGKGRAPFYQEILGILSENLKLCPKFFHQKSDVSILIASVSSVNVHLLPSLLSTFWLSCSVIYSFYYHKHNKINIFH